LSTGRIARRADERAAATVDARHPVDSFE